MAIRVLGLVTVTHLAKVVVMDWTTFQVLSAPKTTGHLLAGADRGGQWSSEQLREV